MPVPSSLAWGSKQEQGQRITVSLVTQLCLTLCDPTDCSPPGSSVHGDSPGKNTGVGCHALLQGIFPTQGLNPGLPHCRQILYHLSHPWSPLWGLNKVIQTKCLECTWHMASNSIKGLSLFIFSKKHNKSSEPYKLEFTAVLLLFWGKWPKPIPDAFVGCPWNTMSQKPWSQFVDQQSVLLAKVTVHPDWFSYSHRQQWIHRTGYTSSILVEVFLGTHAVLFLSPLKWREAAFTSQDLFKDIEELQVNETGGYGMQSPEKVSIITSAFSVNAFNLLVLWCIETRISAFIHLTSWTHQSNDCYIMPQSQNCNSIGGNCNSEQLFFSLPSSFLPVFVVLRWGSTYLHGWN